MNEEQRKDLIDHGMDEQKRGNFNNLTFDSPYDPEYIMLLQQRQQMPHERASFFRSNFPNSTMTMNMTRERVRENDGTFRETSNAKVGTSSGKSALLLSKQKGHNVDMNSLNKTIGAKLFDKDRFPDNVIFVIQESRYEQMLVKNELIETIYIQLMPVLDLDTSKTTEFRAYVPSKMAKVGRLLPTLITTRLKNRQSSALFHSNIQNLEGFFYFLPKCNNRNAKAYLVPNVKQVDLPFKIFKWEDIFQYCGINTAKFKSDDIVNFFERVIPNINQEQFTRFLDYFRKQSDRNLAIEYQSEGIENPNAKKASSKREITFSFDEKVPTIACDFDIDENNEVDKNLESEEGEKTSSESEEEPQFKKSKMQEDVAFEKSIEQTDNANTGVKSDNKKNKSVRKNTKEKTHLHGKKPYKT